MNTLPKKNKPGVKKPRLFRSDEFKLKDKVGRNLLAINFIEHIGFYPELLSIRKVPGKNNSIVLEFTVPDGFDVKKKQQELKAKKEQQELKAKENANKKD